MNSKPDKLPTSAQPQSGESPPANSKDTPLTSTQSHNGENPPVNSKDTPLTSTQSHNGENPPVNSKDTPLTSAQSHNGENPPVNNKDTPLTSTQCHNGESPPMNTKDTPLTSTQSQDVENSLENNEAPHKGNIIRCSHLSEFAGQSGIFENRIPLLVHKYYTFCCRFVGKSHGKGPVHSRNHWTGLPVLTNGKRP